MITSSIILTVFIVSTYQFINNLLSPRPFEDLDLLAADGSELIFGQR